MSVIKDKPAPTRVGVDGFNAFEAKPDAPREAIDWPHLLGLPAFQMFVNEQQRSDPPSQALFDDYCQWHQDKGYWPNEDPLGRLTA